MDTSVPAWRMVQGLGVPAVCALHGRPVGRGRPVWLNAYPSWVWVFVLLGLLPYFLARAATRRTLTIQSWPVCDRCVRRRVVLRAASIAVVVAGLIIHALPLMPAEPLGPRWIAVGLLVSAAGVLSMNWSTWGAVMKARTTGDLSIVTFTAPHPGFAAQLAPLPGETPQPQEPREAMRHLKQTHQAMLPSTTDRSRSA